MNEKFTNIEVVLLAVLSLGGAERSVDIEDIAVKADSLAPGRFAWRKYPQQINIENVRAFLSDAKKPKNGTLVTGSARAGWSLTAAGLNRARQIEHRFAAAAPAPRLRAHPQDARRRATERERLLASDAYLKLRAEGIDDVTLVAAENFFRLDEYVAPDKREHKIARVLESIGTGDEELLAAALALADRVREARPATNHAGAVSRTPENPLRPNTLSPLEKEL